jgi:PAS domain S-box-containing protein
MKKHVQRTGMPVPVNQGGLAVLDMLPQAAWLADKDGGRFWFNRRWFEYTGSLHEEMRGYGWTKIYADRDISERFSEYIRKGASWRHTSEIKGADGCYRRFLTTANLTKDKRNRMIWLGTETEIKDEMTTAAPAEDTVLKQFVDAFPQALVIYSPGGEPEFVNRQWTTYSGQKTEDAPEYFDKCIHPNDRVKRAARWKQSLQSGEEYISQCRLKNDKGEYAWFYERIAPMRDNTGNIRKWIGSMTEIQEMKDYTSLLEKQLADRSSIIRQMDEMLSIQTEELKNSNEDLSSFLYHINRNMQEPVRKLKMFSSLLREETTENLPGNLKVYHDLIMRAAELIGGTMEAVNTYSKICQKTEEDYQLVDLNMIISKVEQKLMADCPGKNICIVCKELQQVHAIPGMMTDLFYNLLGNCVKFSLRQIPPVISIHSKQLSTSEILARPYLDESKNYCLIEIKDNGIGFSATDSEMIFEPFVRLNPRGKYEGVGLGLSLCRKIMERHHGFITATAEVHQGAVFYIYFPMQDKSNG